MRKYMVIEINKCFAEVFSMRLCGLRQAPSELIEHVRVGNFLLSIPGRTCITVFYSLH